MHVQTSLNRSFAFLASLVLAAVLCPAFQAPAAAQKYVVTDLVSNGTGAPNHDPNLVNAWGIANFPGSPFWVSDAGSGKSTLYNGAGTPIPLVVTVPPWSGTGTGLPTGIVANTDTSPTDFVISGKPADFIFATEDGTISGGMATQIRKPSSRSIATNSMPNTQAWPWASSTAHTTSMRQQRHEQPSGHV